MSDFFSRAQEAYQAGQFGKAARLAAKAVRKNANNLDAVLIQAIATFQSGKVAEAVRILTRAAKRWPDVGAFHTNLGFMFQRLGTVDDMVFHYREAARLSPDDPSTLTDLGAALLFARTGYDEAETVLEKAVSLAPAFPSALYNLGILRRRLGEPEAAVDHYRAALTHRPNDVDVLTSLADALDDLGATDEAAAVYRNVLRLAPEHGPALWGASLALPVLYDTEADIARYRAAYGDGLASLARDLRLDDPAHVEGALHAVEARTNFNLPFQGGNDVDLQRTYGGLLCRVARAAYSGSLPKPAGPRSIPDGGRIRVGFVSAFWRRHTVCRLFGDWVRKLDRRRFEVIVFYQGNRIDEETRDIARNCDRFFPPAFGPAEMARTIAEQELDLLVHPDVGMDPGTQAIAALRLAPVQCAAWGHPTTTGLPSVDYFLTSDLMEPGDGESHYTETLVRLPGLSVCYAEPDVGAPPADGPAPRPGPWYLCTQSLFKLLPQHDRLFVDIARTVGPCRFSFIAAANRTLTERMRGRLSRAFAEAGLDADQYLHVYPLMNRDEFFRIHFEHDVVLDSVLWSGGNTAFEAAACARPLVTWPGPMMRGRHSYAIQKAMGVEETIASDLDDYVAIAARLGTDHEWRSAVADRIRARKERVFSDADAIRNLERFIDAAVRSPDDVPFVRPAGAG